MKAKRRKAGHLPWMMYGVFFHQKIRAIKPKKRKNLRPQRLRRLLEKVSKVKKLTTASIDDILGFGSGISAVPSKPIRDPKKVPKQWQAYYDDLMALRASLKGALGERSSETIGASARESSGELSLNSSDAGTETFDRDVALSMVATSRKLSMKLKMLSTGFLTVHLAFARRLISQSKKSSESSPVYSVFTGGSDLYEKRKSERVEAVRGHLLQ